MALKTYVSAGVYDDMTGSSALTDLTLNVTTGGLSSLGFTAPNLVNQANGAWISLSSVPSASNSGDLVVELLESGVVKASGTISYADVELGFNYVRFTTPYTWATLTASAYTIRVRNTSASGSLGQLRRNTTNIWFQCTYDTATTVGATDDVWVAGFDDAGHTTKTLTLSGTSNAWGSATATGIGARASTIGAALTIGKGGTVVFDTSASTTLALKGSVWVGNNGVFDMRGSATKSIVNTLQIESVANGDQGVFSGTTSYGGQILTTGATYDQKTTFTSGLGTAASPLIVGTGWDADVGDEIVVGGGTDYTKNELRYIKTRNSSTSFVLCTTPGGAEVALANTHTAGSHIANLTRNVIIKAKVSTLGFYIYNAGNTVPGSFNYTRLDYSDCSSGKSLAFNNASGDTSTFDGLVLYGNSVAGRQAINITQTVAQTHTAITLYDTRGSNYSGQSGLCLQSATNQTVNSLLHFNGASTNSCAMLSFNISATGNTINDSHSYGANAANSSAGYAVGIFSSSANTFNDCSVNGARQNAVYFSTAIGNVFNNCNFGDIATNTVDTTSLTGTLNQNYFNSCTFGSASLHTNYLNQLDSSICKFQNMDGNSSKHRWYTKYGSWWSAGSGLTDTTVRTAGSLSLVSKPEDNSAGSSWTFKIPANPTSQVGVFGYVYRNATFSSGTLKVELFLPGTLLTATPDATYTFPTTTAAWLPFNISAYYSGSVARYAQVRISGVTATAGAYFFVDDLYDAGTGNKVAGLDLWDEGQPSQIMVQSDFSVVPSAVWGFSDANTQASTMGKHQADLKLTNVLVKDGLS